MPRNPNKRLRKPCSRCNTKFIRLSRFELICPRCCRRARDNGFKIRETTNKASKSQKRTRRLQTLIKQLTLTQRKGLISSRVEGK